MAALQTWPRVTVALALRRMNRPPRCARWYATVILPRRGRTTPSRRAYERQRGFAAASVGAQAMPSFEHTNPAFAAGVIVRIAWESATYTIPMLSTAMPIGRENRAALPVPFLAATPPASPASVLTTPLGVTSRVVESAGGVHVADFSR